MDELEYEKPTMVTVTIRGLPREDKFTLDGTYPAVINNGRLYITGEKLKKESCSVQGRFVEKYPGLPRMTRDLYRKISDILDTEFVMVGDFVRRVCVANNRTADNEDTEIWRYVWDLEGIADTEYTGWAPISVEDIKHYLADHGLELKDE